MAEYVTPDKPDQAKRMLDLAHDAYGQGGSSWAETTHAAATLSMATSLYEMRTWFGDMHQHWTEERKGDEPIATAPPEPVDMTNEEPFHGDETPCPARHHEYGYCALVAHSQYPVHLFRLDDGTLFPVTITAPTHRLFQVCSECGSDDPKIRRSVPAHHPGWSGSDEETCSSAWHNEPPPFDPYDPQEG